MKPFAQFLNLLFPKRCIFCRSFLPADTFPWVCPRCENKYRCLVPGLVRLDDGGSCLFALPYDGAVRGALLSFKFGKRPSYAATLASYLVPLVGKQHVDIVTWVPVSFLRHLQRGYDQSELLARELAKCLGLPCQKLLSKVRNNRPQSTLNGEERRNNVHNVYRCRVKGIGNRRILLVDDIVTTGSTVNEAVKLLYGSGVRYVLPIAVAHRGQ